MEPGARSRNPRRCAGGAARPPRGVAANMRRIRPEAASFTQHENHDFRPPTELLVGLPPEPQAVPRQGVSCAKPAEFSGRESRNAINYFKLAATVLWPREEGRTDFWQPCCI